MRVDGKFLKKFFTHETPSGLVNGSNKDFVLSSAPLEPDAVEVYINGLYEPNFTVSGSTVTLATAPAVAQSVVVAYVRKTGES